MLKLNISKLSEGSSVREQEIAPEQLGLDEADGFKSPIHIRYQITKVGHEIFLKTNVRTNIDLDCDRCLEPFKFEIDETVDILLTTDEQVATDDEEDVYLIGENTSEIDIGHSVVQTILITVPYKKLCREACKGLCPKCGANWNEESCECSLTKVDPRWEALKNIKFNN